MTTDFRAVALLPLPFATPAIPAVLAAGAAIIVDCQGADDAAIARLMERVCALPAAAGALFGLRLSPEQLAASAHWPRPPVAGPLPVVVSDWRDGAEIARLATPERALWVEIGEAGQLARLNDVSTGAIAGLVGRGGESGGACGRQSAFVLAQHLARQQRPFWLQGAIGPHNGAAALVAGAAAVIIDDAALFTRDSALPAPWRALAASIAAQECPSLGEAWDQPCRVAVRPGLGGGQQLAQAAADIAAGNDPAAQAVAWAAARKRLVGWGDPARWAWPVGQGIGEAAALAATHGGLVRLLAAITQAARKAVEGAAQAGAASPLAEQAPLAQAHGTRLAVVQGPMTRVSDSPAFAAAIAASGALPMVAVAMLDGERTAHLLDTTQTALAGRPWGAGLLGYLPSELAEAQWAELARVRPPFALIAGGRPDQAARGRALGIDTYIHVPTPSLLDLFLDQGAERMVFEGAECGGHVGPLSSFALWDAAIARLLALAPARRKSVAVLFAGGIHDALSAAMVAAMAQPLVDAGIAIGILMGSAYLFTAEAVETGAIGADFQARTLGSAATRLIETRPGHRIRCAPSPFIDSFAEQATALARQGCPPAEMGERLETLLTGRLRLAAKGVIRDGERLVAADAARLWAEGVFMIGDVATLHDRPNHLADLHHAVSHGAAAMLAGHAPTVAAPRPMPAQEPVAIIGIGCLLPGADNPDTLWRHLLDQAGMVREIPAERWDWRLYYDADPAARDRITAKWGCFLDPVAFDPIAFGIPPRSLSQICLPQLLALETTRRALLHAGLGDLGHAPELRRRTAAVFAAASAADLEQMYKARTALPLLAQAGEAQWERLPEWSEESYPGILLNVVAGRVANRFDLGGINFTVDAACASSLAALDIAQREVASGRADLALAGAVEAEMSPHAFTAFSKTQALSPTGAARVFDEAADGIVLSEGAVVLVLKRLADATRDGDRVLAVLKGIAGSSDGKGLGLTAPKPEGQMLAIARAHEGAGTRVGDIGLYEAHGTGTKVGDRAELETLTRALEADAPPPDAGPCIVGSAKSLLGHTRAAAGLVGVSKAALALYHRTLPPHAGVTEPLAPLRGPQAPIALLDAPRPWLRPPATPRRAAISAFGFGGTNFHAVLEEPAQPGPAGAAHWPCELMVAAAADRSGLTLALDRLEQAGARLGQGLSLAELAAASLSAAQMVGPARHRLALIAHCGDELARLLGAARAHLDSNAPLPPGLWISPPEGVDTTAPGGLAFLFPGQGSQAPGMGGELAVYFPEMADAVAASGLQRQIWPPAVHDDAGADTRIRALADTRVAQPAIAAISCGMLDLARRFGLTADRVAGHSFGEFVAHHAAGTLSRADLARLARRRGEVMADCGPDLGTMAMAPLGAERLATFVAGIDDVCVANSNAPQQSVLSGRAESIARVGEKLAAAGHALRPLTVSAAFHSPLMAPARQPFADFLAHDIVIHPPGLPVHANLDGQPYPAEAEAIRARWIGHLEQPVDFVAQIQAMADGGIRAFVELGPGRVLGGLARQILHGRDDMLIVSTDGGLRGWLAALGQVWVAGHQVALTALHDGRHLRPLSLERLPEPPAAAGWLMDGGRIHAADQPGQIGARPFRDADSGAEPLAGGLVATAADPISHAYGEYQQTMRLFLDQQERVLSHLLARQGEGEMGLAPAATAPRVASAPAPLAAIAPPARAEAPAQVELDRVQVMEGLVRLVAERTGYPATMLRPDQDLEAELGVDSIKRIEIIAKMLKSLPSGIAGHLQKRFDRLVRAKSLQALVEALLREAPTDLAAAAAQPQPAPRAEGEACPRFVMTAAPKPLPPLPPTHALRGLYLIVTPPDDGQGLAALVADGLGAAGADTALLDAQWLAGEPQALATRLAILREVHGAVRAIVHLGGLGPATRWGDFARWRGETTAATKALFTLLRACPDELADDQIAPLHVVAASRLGGDWGRSGQAGGSLAAAGAHGLLKSLEAEYPHVLTKVVDFDESWPAAELARRIVDEVSNPGGGDEIGYRDGMRLLYTPEPAPLADRGTAADWRPRPGWVVLATGGARGVTAALCRDLAAPGITLVLVGRPEGATSDDGAARERAATLDALRAQGATVEYHGVDVRDADSFATLIDDLYARLGRIDAVLHGAGIIEDQQFAAKTGSSFDRVFDTKADSTYVLASRLRGEGLRWVVLMGSIAGRFGNRGQADYAAGNETMARLGLAMAAAWPQTRVVTIDWGPWRGAGMASEGVQALLEAQGILPIDLDVGARFLADELSWGKPADTEVVAGHGPWEVQPDPLLASVFEATVLLLRAPGRRTQGDDAA